MFQRETECSSICTNFNLSRNISRKRSRTLKIVLKHLIQNPCGNLNPSAMCLVKTDNADCRVFFLKHFPKRTENETRHSEGAYCVTHRRRYMLHEGENAIRKCLYQWTSVERIVDNGWDVTYNPTLSGRFQCHLNIELCVSRIEEIEYFLYMFVKEGIEYRASFETTFCIMMKYLYFNMHVTSWNRNKFGDCLKRATSGVIQL